MNVRFFNPGLSYQKIRSEVLPEIDRVLESGKLILQSDGEQFEREMEKYLGVKHFLGVANGTDALLLVQKALGIGEGDEVICVSHTFIASFSETMKLGARPILVDIGDDYLIDPKKIEEVITPRTKAIIPVHLSGDVANMTEILRIAKEHNLYVIEDAAQAMGAEHDGKKAGTMGIAGTFSFYPAKILGCYGDGGGIATNDDALYEELKEMRNHYKSTYTKIGYNSRLDNVQAAVLSIKLRYLDSWIARRREIGKMYNESLSGINGLVLPTDRPVYQDYVIRAAQRDELKKFLDQNGVQTLGDDSMAYHERKELELNFNLPNTEQYTREFLRLPCNPDLTDEEVRYVISKVREFYYGV